MGEGAITIGCNNIGLRSAEGIDRSKMAYGRAWNIQSATEVAAVFWIISKGLKPRAIHSGTPCTELGTLGNGLSSIECEICVQLTIDVSEHQRITGGLASAENPKNSRLFLKDSWASVFGTEKEPKPPWKYFTGASCKHNLTSPDVKEFGRSIEKKQVWMANFDLSPIALECRSLTQNSMGANTQWNLIGSTHAHRHARGDATTKEGKRLKVAAFSGGYTKELGELYAFCLARGLLLTQGKWHEARPGETALLDPKRPKELVELAKQRFKAYRPCRSHQD
jgi:hypothetical protein